MALVKCPECGRENVSDNAEMCPDCGYGIKAYFDKQKSKEFEQRRMNNIPMPKKPEKQKLSFGQWFFILIWGIFGLILFMVGISSEMGSLALVYLVFGGGLSAFFYYIAVIQDYNKEMDKYNRAMQNFEKYKRDEINEQNIKHAEQVKRYEAKMNNQPICPKCGSTDIIDGTRGFTLTTGFVGSGNFRYICKKCNFKWKPGGWNEALQRDLNKKY